MNRQWHKWLLAGTITFIWGVCYAYQDEVRACLVGIPACHLTVIHKTIQPTQEDEQ